MTERLKPLAESLRAVSGRACARLIYAIPVGVLAAAAYACYLNPPLQNINRGEIGLRLNHLTGGITEGREGSIIVLPGIHTLRRLSLRDQIYRPEGGETANGPSPYQSIEGLSLGVDISIRYAVAPDRAGELARVPEDKLGEEIIAPSVHGVLYKTLARYTVREIFSSKRQEIKDSLEGELKPMLEKDGIVLKTVLIGKVDLPRDYKAGMEKLLAEELASEKMRYTLELKEKQIKQTDLEAEAAKVKREKDAEAAGQEQIIAAKAQAEAMKHILPFKQKQIEQRSLEAEAEKVARIKSAEAASQARQIEATGEAESRRKLADAEVYRQERIGKTTSEQMARDGALLSRHPLLIQKAMADKLSDKISVIIAPPPADGGFIGSTLLGKAAAQQNANVNGAQNDQPADSSATEEGE